ncbi:hypothetical protein PAP_05200 [Palaeococcus pacificus DY20341]|uniref:Uncharacterized protein n=1 Tax=Palaeococcus pacificus DY20341 TaxID=1343739 RepID=A0A075LTK6_9EURY|nr:hypothetical protein [Palaeococcus pacificus]AIF69451.1 hypothetical protein PAP_05200 [Palaeococcus pacificus DY20341]
MNTKEIWESERIKKMIEVLEFFYDGKRTITEWGNAHNQEYDWELFSLLISEGLLKVPGISEREKAELERKITHLAGKYNNKLLKVTKDGYEFLTNYYFNKRSLELNERALRLSEEVARMTKEMRRLTWFILIMTGINVLLVFYSVLR